MQWRTRTADAVVIATDVELVAPNNDAIGGLRFSHTVDACSSPTEELLVMSATAILETRSYRDGHEAIGRSTT